ncbi:unnamed protein product [Linum trigynum]|uniref:Uncharacterized protein n=1 Tax=Linum trigynum TaxID=586398 RepID=A0AAV2GZH1_9ROSI
MQHGLTDSFWSVYSLRWAGLYLHFSPKSINHFNSKAAKGNTIEQTVVQGGPLPRRGPSTLVTLRGSGLLSNVKGIWPIGTWSGA